jgi:S-adenosylmethionine:tRNA ribosyltransferase-isomerase
VNAASRPAASRNARLLVIDEHGISHRHRTDFPSLLQPGDLVVANDAATLPASLHGLHVPTGEAIEVRLAGRSSPSSESATTFTAVMFGAGDYRTPTEGRAMPPALNVDDEVRLGPLTARIVEIQRHPRLVQLRFDGSAQTIWDGISHHGKPIQYSYVPEPLALWDTWTRIASDPVAFEAPSAGFILDWAMLRAIRARGARFATITHAAGISSTGDPDLDRLLPFDEPYRIPPSTARLVARTRVEGGRVIAVGTTVVRALENDVDEYGRVASGSGIATNRIGPATTLSIVDAIVSGMHEPGTSHYELLKAFVSASVLAQATRAAEWRGYEAHEFGDAAFIVRRDVYPMRTFRGNCELSSRNVFLRESSSVVG